MGRIARSSWASALVLSLLLSLFSLSSSAPQPPSPSAPKTRSTPTSFALNWPTSVFLGSSAPQVFSTSAARHLSAKHRMPQDFRESRSLGPAKRMGPGFEIQFLGSNNLMMMRDADSQRLKCSGLPWPSISGFQKIRGSHSRGLGASGFQGLGNLGSNSFRSLGVGLGLQHEHWEIEEKRKSLLNNLRCKLCVFQNSNRVHC